MAISNSFTNEKDWDVKRSDSLKDGHNLSESIPEETVIPLLTNISEISKFVGVWEKEKSK